MHACVNYAHITAYIKDTNKKSYQHFSVNSFDHIRNGAPKNECQNSAAQKKKNICVEKSQIQLNAMHPLNNSVSGSFGLVCFLCVFSGGRLFMALEVLGRFVGCNCCCCCCCCKCQIDKASKERAVKMHASNNTQKTVRTRSVLSFVKMFVCVHFVRCFCLRSHMQSHYTQNAIHIHNTTSTLGTFRTP